jgi:hypothetical protein
VWIGSTTDLGKTHSNFSCKNESSKVYTSFAKAVGLVTRSKKIGFAFFGFFYDFLWILQVIGPRGKETKNLLAE